MSARPPNKSRAKRLPPSPAEIARVAVLALFFLAAPTAGDIGGCGQEAQDLDARKFFTAKESIDCAKCFECDFNTLACEKACDLEPNRTSFEAGCYPLVHDGEVCLNALDAAGCAEYASYVADEGAAVPTECNFCPAASRPTTALPGKIIIESDARSGGL